MSTNMLTEQNVVLESTDSSDTMPIGLITTDDGHTLLAMGEYEDGTLKIMAAPIALMPQNNMVSPTLVKTVDGNFILHSPVFQLNVEGLSGTGMQQANLLPMIQHLENGPGIIEQLKLAQNANECAVTEPLSPIKADSNVLLDKEQATIDNTNSESMPVSILRNIYRSPGRPKKTGNTQFLKCDICRQEFTKRMLYRRHMQNHAEEKPHRCPKCSASFNIPTNFTLHMATHNTGDPKCPECGRKYARMASLKSHMLLHEKEENLFCTECEDAFLTKFTYADRRLIPRRLSAASEESEMRAAAGFSLVNRNLIIAEEALRGRENESRRRETHEGEEEEEEEEEVVEEEEVEETAVGRSSGRGRKVSRSVGRRAGRAEKKKKSGRLREDQSARGEEAAGPRACRKKCNVLPRDAGRSDARELKEHGNLDDLGILLGAVGARSQMLRGRRDGKREEEEELYRMR